MRIQKSQNFMILRPIACLIWSGSRISGQKSIWNQKKENHGSIKIIKERGNPEKKKIQNPYFAHNSTPVGAKVC